MLVFAYFIFFLELVIAQRQSFRGGNRYAPVPYYNLGPKPGNGVGVLQDLSNARILSNEPFIISFEFPKLVGTGDSRKNRFGVKRTKSQRKKNRKPRQFRHIVVPQGDILERRKRLQILRQPPSLENLRVPTLLTDEKRTGKAFANAEDPSERTNYGRLMNFEMKEKEEQATQVENQETTKHEKGSNEEMESVHRENWENIKKKWLSLFAKSKEEENAVEGEGARDEEILKAMSRKMWANCQLLKLLKAPQRNPYFYKLLPPNYPALIMNEEKQLECNQFYDIIDLAKDKKMISEKIEQLERILSSGNDSGNRRKRETPAEEDKSEEENTLQDETLQGKSEGEVRSDRSKRTKERQHVRRQRSKEPPKEKIRRLHRTAKKSTPIKNEKQEKEESERVLRARRKDSVTEAPKKILEEGNLNPEEDATEKKREKQEIRTGSDNGLQDVFNPSEVSKVVRQKEMEANIFDKVLRAMKKFEENYPYDESFRPQKRESGNNTEIMFVQKNDSGEEGMELEDTIKKLAKIFKILGVKAEAAKKKAKESGESSSEESDGTVNNSRTAKSSKCTCADCPLCQDCFQCFKECRKALHAAKNGWINQTPVSASQVAAGKDSNSERDFTLTSGQERDPVTQNEEHVNYGERSNNVKPERMYRSKLPPSRDLVRVYFDNPENKLLVWTKRGRRTMPWGPLTSDLQLYRDRARQILKSAEDILHRIRETEEHIHTGHYEESERGTSPDTSQIITSMDDIIKKVVNEDETKSMLRTPWEAELEKGVLDGNVVQSNQISKHIDEETNENIFKDGIRERTELPIGSLTMEDAKKGTVDGDQQTDEIGESIASYEVGRVEAAEPKSDTRSETESIEENAVEGDNKSVEAAVLPIDKEEMTEKVLNDNNSEKNPEDPKEKTGSRKEQEEAEKEDEDVPAKVEAVNQDKVMDGAAWKVEYKENRRAYSQNRKQILEYMKKTFGKPENVKHVTDSQSKEEFKAVGDELENVKKAEFDETQSVEGGYGATVDEQRSHTEDSSEEGKSYSQKSQKVEKAHREESKEEEKTHIRESEETAKAYSEESGEKDESNMPESEEVEKTHTKETEDEENSHSSKSEEVKKAYSKKSRQKGKIYNRKLGKPEKVTSEESEENEKFNRRESEDVEKAYSEKSKEKGKSYHKELEEVERAYSKKSKQKEKSYSRKSENQGKVTNEGSAEEESSYSEDSVENDKSYGRKSEKLEKVSDEQSAEKGEFYREETEEKEKSSGEKVEKVHPEDSAEEERAFSEHSMENNKSYGRKSEKLERVLDEQSVEKKKSHNEETEEKEKSYSRESEEVEKAYNEESEEKENANSRESGEVGKANTEKSTEKEKSNLGDAESKNYEKESKTKTGVRKEYSNESEEAERAFDEESDIKDAAYSGESESVEKAREIGSELEDVERKTEKMIGELRKVVKEGETGTTSAKKPWKQTADMEKNAEKIIKELKKAVKMEKDEKIIPDKQKEESGEEVEKSEYEKEESEEDIPSYENAEEVEMKENDVEEESEEEVQDAKEEEPSAKVEGRPKDEKNALEDHIKSIEESYIIKGVKQTKEEKEAILKALLNVEKKQGVGEEVVEAATEEATAMKTPEVTVESHGDSLKTVVQHLERGHMDENDLDAIKKLDESQMDLLVGEMQKSDEKGTSVNCETRMKLCQAICSCNNNGTQSDLSKYEIIKGFLAWLKDLKTESIVPISA